MAWPRPRGWKGILSFKAGPVLCACLLAGILGACSPHSDKKLIVIGVDGMDPGFVERHWSDLPHLDRLRREGRFTRLATTTPPQSPVAWSTFITGLDPADHGIFDFVHRDPRTREPFLSTDRTVEARFRIPLGAWQIPLSSPRIESLRRGKAFWQTLSERGVPVTIVRMPANYPPLPFGDELAGMGTPDLRGTRSTFSFFTDSADETSRAVPGGLIRRVTLIDRHVDLTLEGPPNSLRSDHAWATVNIAVDVDPDLAWARLSVNGAQTILQQGEWSDWIAADFPLLPHLASARGMFRVFAKELRPGFALYISPVNVDPLRPALPVSSPASFAKSLGRFYTVGIPEDTAALRQGVFDLPQFLAQSRLVLDDERGLLGQSLSRYKGGFLFFYFSTIDQNSHMLWGRHDDELLGFYRAVDASIGLARRREPKADLIVMSDHGFSTFDTAVNLNTWLARNGFGDKAYAMGLNALYLTGADGGEIRRKLLAFRPVIESVTDIHPAPANRAIAPDMVIGYGRGYRASWRTGLGEAGDEVLEANTDAWIADHCIDAAEVPGVLFTTAGVKRRAHGLKDLSGAILNYFGAQ